MNLNKAKAKGESYVLANRRVSNPCRPSVTALNVASVTAHTDDLERALIGYLAAYGSDRTVVGCVAWLSNPRILKAMSQRCKRMLLLVNDEDYGRWGSGRCPERYAELPRFTEPLWQAFAHLDTPLRVLDHCARTGLPLTACGYRPVRCFGQRTFKANDDRDVAGPKSRGGFSSGTIQHSKYLVFLDANERPAAVWTGSFNFTANAVKNQENALFLVDPVIAKHYFDDFANSFVHSYELRCGSSAPKKRARTASVRPVKRAKTASAAYKRRY